MINDFLIITGDKNPIHMKNQFCKDFTDFKEKIVPGALILSIFSAIIGNHYPGIGSIIIKQEIKFKKPIFLETKIKLVIEELKIIKIKNIHKLNIFCYDDKNILTVDGLFYVQNNFEKNL